MTKEEEIEHQKNIIEHLNSVINSLEIKEEALLEEVKELKKAIEIYEEGYLLLNNQLEQ